MTSTAAELLKEARAVQWGFEPRVEYLEPLVLRLADALEAATTDGDWQWGYTHSQGINWLGDEARARADMAVSIRGDGRSQTAYQKRQRLVKRWVGNPLEVENPWAVGGTE